LLVSVQPPIGLSRENELKVDAIIRKTEVAVAHAERLARVAADNNSFAAALYAALRRDGNQCFSPLSVRTALLMACLGARGETRTQMRAALCISMSDDALYPACGALVRSLVETGGRHELTIANSVWSQTGAPIDPIFVGAIDSDFGGSWSLVDFRFQAEAARRLINEWVSDRTHGRISDLLAPGSPAPDTRVVLANAIYFKGTWSSPFDPELTRGAPFFPENGRPVLVPMMEATESVGYPEGPNYHAVRLTYLGDALALLVILPKARDGLRDVETTLSPTMIRECMHAPTRRVNVFLPRFRITWGTTDLCDALSALGIRLAFTPQADFSGINGRLPPDDEALFVSAVLHKAFIDVNEEGTEAAAATVVDTMLGCAFPSDPPPVPVFRADHPFAFALCDLRSGALVFLGRVVDPTKPN
jgi:serpin B